MIGRYYCKKHKIARQHRKGPKAFTRHHFHIREKGVWDFNSISLRGHKSGAGFTLIEMIVALSVFMIIILIATNVYVVINNSQRKVATMQKIQDDVRYLTEVIAQDIRLGKINYDFYINKQIDLHPNASTPISVLAVINQLGESVFYWQAADNTVRYCQQESSTDCDLSDYESGWQNVTPESVEITELEFIITPSADPFTEVTERSCTTDGDCTSWDTYRSYRCNGRCEYYTDGHNFQPKVRVIVKAQGRDKSIVEQSKINLQTIISTRPAQGTVKNTNYN